MLPEYLLLSRTWGQWPSAIIWADVCSQPRIGQAGLWKVCHRAMPPSLCNLFHLPVLTSSSQNRGLQPIGHIYQGYYRFKICIYSKKTRQDLLFLPHLVNSQEPATVVHLIIPILRSWSEKVAMSTRSAWATCWGPHQPRPVSNETACPHQRSFAKIVYMTQSVFSKL